MARESCWPPTGAWYASYFLQPTKASDSSVHDYINLSTFSFFFFFLSFCGCGVQIYITQSTAAAAALPLTVSQTNQYASLSTISPTRIDTSGGSLTQGGKEKKRKKKERFHSVLRVGCNLEELAKLDHNLLISLIVVVAVVVFPERGLLVRGERPNNRTSFFGLVSRLTLALIDQN